ncbi:hypothetical protein ACR6C2_22050 [Streptomyces sp. INA 01156]
MYPDVMRAARSLEESFTQKGLDEATARVRRALEAAARPLRLANVPGSGRSRAPCSAGWRPEAGTVVAVAV